MTAPALRLGTRASPLARAQTEQAAAALSAQGLTTAIIAQTSEGDRLTRSALADFGGKGLFTRGLDQAVQDGQIDIAVHSLKDVPAPLPNDLCIAAVLPREDPRDIWIGAAGGGIDALPQGATVGTASPRRRAQLLHRRPDLRVVLLRGSVETRLAKLADGGLDGTLLAAAGLKRLGIWTDRMQALPCQSWLPALAQGIVALVTRRDRQDLRTQLASLDHVPTRAAMVAERAVLAGLNGTCVTPIGGLATQTSRGRLSLRVELFGLDGQDHYAADAVADLDAPDQAAAQVVQQLRARVLPDRLAQILGR